MTASADPLGQRSTAHGSREVHQRRRPGRPAKLTRELQRELCLLLRTGATLTEAAASVGVSRSTLYRWLDYGRGQGAPERCRAFVEAVEKAQAESRLVALVHLRRAAAKGSWHAAAALLELRFPENWALNRHGIAAGHRAAARRPVPAAYDPDDAGVTRRCPTKLTFALRTRLCLAFRIGGSMAEAAAYAGISTSTLYRWLADAHQPDAHPTLRALPRELRQAEAQAEIDALIVIQRAAATHWRAAAWWLQRTDVDDWGPVDDYGRRRYTRQPDGFGRERLQRRKYGTPASPRAGSGPRLEQALSSTPLEEPVTNLDSRTVALIADAVAEAPRHARRVTRSGSSLPAQHAFRSPCAAPR